MKNVQKMYSKKDERGVVSILSVIFFIILMSVLTVSFMRMVTDEQTQVINDDLSKGALAAAQSGVEDAKRALMYCRSNPTATPCAGLTNSTCQGFFAGGNFQTELGLNVLPSDGSVQVGDPSNNQRYTCVTIDSDTADYRAIMSEEKVELIPLRGTAAFDGIRFSWRGVDDAPMELPTENRLRQINAAPASSINQLPRKQEWRDPSGDPYLAVPRLQILDFDMTAALDAQNDNSAGMFVIPLDNGGSAVVTNIALPGANNGINPTSLSNKRQTAVCGTGVNDGYRCRVTVSFGGTVPANHQYFLAVKSVYGSADFKVELMNGSTVVNLDDVQPEVDSTGVAGNSYKRVISRVAYEVDGFLTTNVIESGAGVCKDFFVTRSSMTSDTNCLTP